MRALLAVACAAVLFAAMAGAARADVAPIANDGSDPWAGGTAVTSPLESVAGAIASTIAGRAVSVRCEGDSDWVTIAGANGFEPTQVLGFVNFLGTAPAAFAELAPDICRSLQTFAAATAKPTKCVARSQPQYTTTVVREKVVKLVSGKRVVTYRTRNVTTKTYVDAAQPAGPCFVGGHELTTDVPFWNAYFYTAEALQTLAHEAIHLKGDRSESEAECYGMQWISYAAQQLGDTPDDAASIAQYYATRLYPQRQSQSPAYWSPDCRQDGPLDLTPNDGVWP